MSILRLFSPVYQEKAYLSAIAEFMEGSIIL